MRLIRSDEPMTEEMLRYQRRQGACQAYAWTALVILVLCLVLIFLGVFAKRTGHIPLASSIALTSFLLFATSSAVHWHAGRRLKKASDLLEANLS